MRSANERAFIRHLHDGFILAEELARPKCADPDEVELGALLGLVLGVAELDERNLAGKEGTVLVER